MNRRLALAAVVALVLLVAGAAYLLWPAASAINAENAARIKAGMSLAEGEEIMGGLVRDESSGPLLAELDEPFEDARERELQEQNRVDSFARGLWGGPHDPERSHLWVSDRAMVRVDCDDEGCVI